jgi:ABC-type branched-subunit amino acid transport system ATPase component
MGNAELYRIMKEKDALYAKEDFTDEDGIRASELEYKFAEMNGWEAESDASRLIQGLGFEEEILYRTMNELKESEKVKILLAQALFGNPEIILLDEPSLGLAPIIVEDIFKKIKQINQENGTTILLVEQNSRLALNTASRAYVLQNGEIALEGTSEELLNDVRVQHAYLGISG